MIPVVLKSGVPGGAVVTSEEVEGDGTATARAAKARRMETNPDRIVARSCQPIEEGTQIKVDRAFGEKLASVAEKRQDYWDA